MIHEVPLSHYPDNLHVPDDLKERFWYDADRKRLCFNGFMSKATYDRLETLHRDEQYQHSLDGLFRICVPEAAVDKSKRARVVIVAVTAALAVIVLVGLAVWLVLVR